MENLGIISGPAVNTDPPAFPRLWLSVEEASPVIGDKPDKIYRDIREKQFPFEFVRIGKRIKISARSLGLASATPV